MPVALKDGEQRPTMRYRSVKELNRGAMANSYKAEVASGPGMGKIVFLKQYKSPTCTVSWYKDYVDYQKEMKRRIDSDPELKSRCYELIEFFENKGGKDSSGTFYQVFEFVEGGIPLTDYIKKFREDSAAVEWKHRVIFARVMMFAIDYLHKAKIIHTDLKPDNLFMIPNPGSAGFSLKLIDFDFSIMADKQAPWHGKDGAGYVGTPGYHSPEHLQGKIPQMASDIYTCGLMLGELLGEGHPLRKESDIAKAPLLGKFEPVKIKQPINKVENIGFLECIINACFNVDPDKRPTARQLVNALKGEVFEWAGWTGESHTSSHVASPSASSKPPAPLPKAPIESPSTLNKDLTVEFYFGDKKVAGCSLDTTFGIAHLKAVHEDSKFLSKEQFTIYKDTGSGSWAIAHIKSATNETIVDGQALVNPVFLQDGMRVSVGKTDKHIEKLPLTIKLIQK